MYKNNIALHVPYIPKLWYSLLFTVLILVSISFIVLYSSAEGNIEFWVAKQFYCFVTFLIIAVVISFIRIEIIYQYSYHVYCICFMLVILASLFGHNAMGAQRWLRIGPFTLQPSELMKVAVILALSKYFHHVHSNLIKHTKHLIIPIIITIAPSIVILKQPNLGTAIIIFAIGNCIFFVSGIMIRKFLIVGALLLFSCPIIWFCLYEYQKKRILTFLDPESDLLGAGYNIMQSKIAIGSGGICGKGLLFGTQNHLSFLPEGHTDFIFAILAEEFGFIGTIIVLLVYTTFIVICYIVSLSASSHFARLITIGAASFIFIQIFINLSMISGILPVVGIPAPFLSYGRSNLSACLLITGCVLNVIIHKNTNIMKRKL